MKFKIYLLGFLLLFLTSCTVQPAGYSSDIKDPQAFEKSYWFANNDLKLIRTDRNFEKVKKASDVILKLNHRFQKEYHMPSDDQYYLAPPQLKYQKLEGDTLYVKLENAEYVTQKLGTTGGQLFMAIATFTLTEVEGVKNIYFDFEEGDHASPGQYSRTYEEFQQFLLTDSSSDK